MLDHYFPFFPLIVLTEGVKRVATEVMAREGEESVVVTEGRGGSVVATEERGGSVVETEAMEIEGGGTEVATEERGESGVETEEGRTGVEGMVATKAEGDRSTTTKVGHLQQVGVFYLELNLLEEKKACSSLDTNLHNDYEVHCVRIILLWPSCHSLKGQIRSVCRSRCALFGIESVGREQKACSSLWQEYLDLVSKWPSNNNQMFAEQDWGDLTPAGEPPSSLHRHGIVPQQQPQFGASGVNSWGNELWDVPPPSTSLDDKVRGVGETNLGVVK